MTAPTTWPTGWERVFVRGVFTDLRKLVAEQASVGVSGSLEFELAPDEVVYQDPGDVAQHVDTSQPFGAPIDPVTGLVIVAVPVGDSSKVSPLGFTTRVRPPIGKPFDVLISKDLPVLDDPEDDLHGERVLDLGLVSVDPISGGIYHRLPGPPGAGVIDAGSTAPGGSNDLSPYYVAATGDLDQSIEGLKTFLDGVRLPTADTDPAAPIRRDDPSRTNARPPVTHAHDGADITAGTVAFGRLPVGAGASQVAQGNHTHPYAASSHTHNASAVTAGTLDIARLPVGDASTQVARGDTVANLRRKLFGAAAASYAPGCHLFRPADGTAISSGANVLVNSWTAESDPGSMYSAGAVTIPNLEAGNFRWRIQFTLHFVASATGVRYGYITRNTSSLTPTSAQTLKEQGAQANAAGGAGDTIDVIYTGPLNAGDVLRFLVFQSSGAGLLLTAAARTAQDTFVDITLAGAIS